jgi:plasmid replication initiation protein
MRSYVKSNDFINGKYSLNLHQAQFLCYMISLVRVDDKDFKNYEISLTDLLKIMNVERKNWKQLSIALTLLMQKVVILHNTKTRIAKTTLLSWFDIDTETDIVKFSFHESMQPLLLELKSKFTQTNLKTIFRFRSVYTIKFHEMIKRELGFQKKKNNNQSKITFKYNLEELKEILTGDFDIKQDKVVYPKTYNLYGDFKRKVIQVAQKELKAKSNYSFEFEEKKTKRKVTSIIFTATEAKSEEKQKINEIDKSVDVIKSIRTYNEYLEMAFENKHFNLIKRIRESKSKVFFRPYFMNKINLGSNYYPHVTFAINSKSLIVNKFSKEVLDKPTVNAVICFLADHEQYLYDIEPKFEEYIGFYFDIKITAKNVLGYFNDETKLFLLKAVEIQEDMSAIVTFEVDKQMCKLRFKDVKTFIRKLDNLKVKMEDVGFV